MCARLASRQKGIVRHEQLLAAGISRSAIRRLIASGFLHRLHHGVCAVGHLALPELAVEQAALFACGPRSVISHRSAAHMWGFAPDRPPEVDVTLPGTQRRPKTGLRIHRVTRLDERDVRRKAGLRLTSPPRTILDLAGEVNAVELEQLMAEARARRLISDRELERALARAGQRPGTGKLRVFLRSEGGRAMTRSGIERRCRRLLEAAGLPQPKVNHRVAGYEVDFLWPEHRVILEVDTYTFHGHRRAFERDRRKTMALEDAGYLVIRVTRRQLLEDPYWVIAHIARALERRSQGAR